MELELDLELNREKLGLVFLGLVLGAGLSFAYANLSMNGQAAGEDLASFLENQSGQELEVVRTESAGEFYRVDVRTSDDRLVTYYTDGENRFTQEMQDQQQIQDRNIALAEFQQCLAESGTVMFGNASQAATQQQIQAMGGAAVVAPIYRDVSNTTYLRQAAQLGVQQVPAFYRNQSVIQGAQQIQTLEQFTGCQLN